MVKLCETLPKVKVRKFEMRLKFDNLDLHPCFTETVLYNIFTG